MGAVKAEKRGMVYIWHDKVRKRFYVGAHWGIPGDSYICSSQWMIKAHKKRPQDFKRKILANDIPSRKEMFEEEFRWLSMIKPEELGNKYYNLRQHHANHWSANPDARTIGQKISDANKGKSRPCPPGRGEAISLAKKGVPHTQEHKDALKISRARQVFTEESKQKRTESLKLAYQEGRRTSLKGVPSKRKLPLPCCLACGEPTPSRRASYCAVHRYEVMNESRAAKAGSKWSH